MIMHKLNPNWFVENRVDFELKKYQLLGYLKQVNTSFNKHKLYPHLGDLVAHYRNLNDFILGKKNIQDQFPEKINAIELETQRLHYEKLVKEKWA